MNASGGNPRYFQKVIHEMRQLRHLAVDDPLGFDLDWISILLEP